jgi:hypothetical protein
MLDVGHRQSPVETWKRRQRRRHILSAIAIIVLFAALLYGWLYVYGVTGLHGSHGTGVLTPATRSARIGEHS